MSSTPAPQTAQTQTIPSEIPTVDLNDLRSQDNHAVARASNAINRAFGQYGLVYVKGHSVNLNELETFYHHFRAFVARPEAEKKPFGRADLWYQRGWTPPNTEVAVASGGQPDFKECYFAAPIDVDAEAANQYPELYPPNVFPEDSTAFKDGFIALGKALHNAGELLLQGCATALGLPTNTFIDAIAGAPHVTRVLNYLPLRPDQVNTGIVWGEEHTDFNLLTLLPGGRFYDPNGSPCARPDNQSGLYLRTRATNSAPGGTLLRGTAPDGCLVAQVGQQLEILTGGTYLATPHVITAPGVPGYSRLSAAHFIHLHSNQVMFPLKPFQNAETVRAYCPPVLAGTYSIKTLVDIGLAPASALEKLGYRHYDRLVTMRANTH